MLLLQQYIRPSAPFFLAGQSDAVYHESNGSTQHRISICSHDPSACLSDAGNTYSKHGFLREDCTLAMRKTGMCSMLINNVEDSS